MLDKIDIGIPDLLNPSERETAITYLQAKSSVEGIDNLVQLASQLPLDSIYVYEGGNVVLQRYGRRRSLLSSDFIEMLENLNLLRKTIGFEEHCKQVGNLPYLDNFMFETEMNALLCLYPNFNEFVLHPKIKGYRFHPDVYFKLKTTPYYLEYKKLNPLNRKRYKAFRKWISIVSALCDQNSFPEELMATIFFKDLKGGLKLSEKNLIKSFFQTPLEGEARETDKIKIKITRRTRVIREANIYSENQYFIRTKLNQVFKLELDKPSVVYQTGKEPQDACVAETIDDAKVQFVGRGMETGPENLIFIGGVEKKQQERVLKAVRRKLESNLHISGIGIAWNNGDLWMLPKVRIEAPFGEVLEYMKENGKRSLKLPKTVM